jgi:hypothetical protein
MVMYSIRHRFTAMTASGSRALGVPITYDEIMPILKGRDPASSAGAPKAASPHSAAQPHSPNASRIIKSAFAPGAAGGGGGRGLPLVEIREEESCDEGEGEGDAAEVVMAQLVFRGAGAAGAAAAAAKKAA